ncbi:MAG: T9SS type A sorting domain-containing protein [Bacteroidales bacterium]|jgi:poly(3-hydroxybutyrate) depolymerase|nr:T9SS type A sorting domain-containing protein [Bacteroidales bacterium]
MKKFFLFVFAVAFVATGFAQTLKTMTFAGQERAWIEIAPANTGVAKPVMFLLHGLGDTISDYAEMVQTYANKPDWYYIIPQALHFNVDIPGVFSQDMGPAWNVGATIDVPLGTEPLVMPINAEIDDPGFLLAILDSLNADKDSVFFSGFSLGGFMSNRMGIEHSSRINAIASVSGTIGNNLYDSIPTAPVHVLHIHGTADDIISYADGSLNMLVQVNIGLGAEACVDFWINHNACDTVPSLYAYPNTADDDLTFERYNYTNPDNQTRVSFIKVENGAHEWYKQPAHDIDYFKEVVKFFGGVFGSGVPVRQLANSNTCTIYPNPVSNTLHVKGTTPGMLLQIYNILGSKVLETKLEQTENSINVSFLPKGLYLVKIENITRKIVIQ